VDVAAVIALVLFLAFVTLAVAATVRTVRAVRDTVARGTAQARRVVEDNRLRARRYTVSGPAAEVARLRLDLRTCVDSTFAALDAGRAQDASLAEAAALFARLNDHARALDSELKLLEREPDRSRLAERLPALTERTRSITQAADSLRWAAQDRARHFADDELTALGRDIRLEADALRHWTPAVTDSSSTSSPAAGTSGSPPPVPPVPGAPSGPAPGRGPAPAPERGPGAAERWSKHAPDEG
jgi:hypothetical protein